VSSSLATCLLAKWNGAEKDLIASFATHFLERISQVASTAS